MREKSLALSFPLQRRSCVLYEFFLWLECAKSQVAPVKVDPNWAPFTDLSYKELGLLISAREVGLPIFLTLTDSVKH